MLEGNFIMPRRIRKSVVSDGFQICLVLIFVVSLILLISTGVLLAFPETDDTTTNLPDNWKEPENIWAYGEQVSGQLSSSENTEYPDNWNPAPFWIGIIISIGIALLIIVMLIRRSRAVSWDELG